MIDWKASIRQALTPRQLVNHSLHVGAAVLLLVPFLAGFSLGRTWQGFLVVALVFGWKELLEISLRVGRGREAHLVDSGLDLLIVLLACALCLKLSASWLPLGLGGASLFAGGLYFRRRFPS